MTYTVEQKALAVLRKQLWWRFPKGFAGAKSWSLMTDDLSNIDESDIDQDGAEYYIGDDYPPEPRELNELEVELLNCLREVVVYAEQTGNEWMCLVDARAAIAKAEAA